MNAVKKKLFGTFFYYYYFTKFHLKVMAVFVWWQCWRASHRQMRKMLWACLLHSPSESEQAPFLCGW